MALQRGKICGGNAEKKNKRRGEKKEKERKTKRKGENKRKLKGNENVEAKTSKQSLQYLHMQSSYPLMIDEIELGDANA